MMEVFCSRCHAWIAWPGFTAHLRDVHGCGEIIALTEEEATR